MIPKIIATLSEKQKYKQDLNVLFYTTSNRVQKLKTDPVITSKINKLLNHVGKRFNINHTTPAKNESPFAIKTHIQIMNSLNELIDMLENKQEEKHIIDTLGLTKPQRSVLRVILSTFFIVPNKERDAYYKTKRKYFSIMIKSLDTLSVKIIKNKASKRSYNHDIYQTYHSSISSIANTKKKWLRDTIYLIGRYFFESADMVEPDIKLEGRNKQPSILRARDWHHLIIKPLIRSITLLSKKDLMVFLSNFFNVKPREFREHFNQPIPHQKKYFSVHLKNGYVDSNAFNGIIKPEENFITSQDIRKELRKQGILNRSNCLNKLDLFDNTPAETKKRVIPNITITKKVTETINNEAVTVNKTVSFSSESLWEALKTSYDLEINIAKMDMLLLAFSAKGRYVVRSKESNAFDDLHNVIKNRSKEESNDIFKATFRPKDINEDLCQKLFPDALFRESHLGKIPLHFGNVTRHSFSTHEREVFHLNPFTHSFLIGFVRNMVDDLVKGYYRNLETEIDNSLSNNIYRALRTYRFNKDLEAVFEDKNFFWRQAQKAPILWRFIKSERRKEMDYLLAGKLRTDAFYEIPEIKHEDSAYLYHYFQKNNIINSKSNVPKDINLAHLNIELPEKYKEQENDILSVLKKYQQLSKLTNYQKYHVINTMRFAYDNRLSEKATVQWNSLLYVREDSKFRHFATVLDGHQRFVISPFDNAGNLAARKIKYFISIFNNKQYSIPGLRDLYLSWRLFSFRLQIFKDWEKAFLKIHHSLGLGKGMYYAFTPEKMLSLIKGKSAEEWMRYLRRGTSSKYLLMGLAAWTTYCATIIDPESQTSSMFGNLNYGTATYAAYKLLRGIASLIIIRSGLQYGHARRRISKNEFTLLTTIGMIIGRILPNDHPAALPLKIVHELVSLYKWRLSYSKIVDNLENILALKFSSLLEHTWFLASAASILYFPYYVTNLDAPEMVLGQLIRPDRHLDLVWLTGLNFLTVMAMYRRALKHIGESAVERMSTFE